MLGTASCGDDFLNKVPDIVTTEKSPCQALERSLFRASTVKRANCGELYSEKTSFARMLPSIHMARELFTRKFSIESLRVYCNIQNLHTFTKYKGYDPEIGAYNQQVLLRGVDYARYPSQRMFTFGLNVSL